MIWACRNVSIRELARPPTLALAASPFMDTRAGRRKPGETLEQRMACSQNRVTRSRYLEKSFFWCGSSGALIAATDDGRLVATGGIGLTDEMGAFQARTPSPHSAAVDGSLPLAVTVTATDSGVGSTTPLN